MMRRPVTSVSLFLLSWGLGILAFMTASPVVLLSGVNYHLESSGFARPPLFFRYNQSTHSIELSSSYGAGDYA